MKSLLLASLATLSAAAMAQSPLVTTMIGGFVLNPPAGQTFNSNTVYFDMTVTAPTGLIITQMDLRAQNGIATTSFDVYLTAAGGTHTGNHSNAAAWTLATSASAPVATLNPTVLNFDRAFYVAPGTYGVAIHHKDCRHVYTNGATQVPPLPTVFTTAEMSVDVSNGRIQNSTLAAPFSGGESGIRTPNVTIYYQTTSAAQFLASPRAGTSPLTVQFTDGSASMDPLGFSIYAWDLDGDGIDDNFTQNPTFTYGCGNHTVRLTVFDSLGTYSVTRADVIVVDQLNANFTWSFVGNPSTVQFTDTSGGVITNWAWDLDGDTIVDSNAQNPLWVYAPGCGPTTVTLTTSNSCRTASRTIDIASTPSIEAPFTANNAGAAGAGNYFDANVTAQDGIEVCGLHVHCNDGLGGTPITVDFYYRDGTYVGSDTSAVGWTQVSGTGVSAPFGTPTYVQLASPVYLTPGVHGIAVHLNGIGPAYTNGNGANQAFSNADVALTLGVARTAPFGGTLFTPRVWNGRLNYTTASQGMPGYYQIGAGCAGPLGIPGNVGVARPSIGPTMAVDFTNVPVGVLAFIGVSNASFGGIPLPLDAGIIGAPGCNILMSADVNGGLAFATAGVAPWLVPIPLDPAFLGVRLYTQGLSFDGTNALGGSFSDGAAMLIGN